MVSVPSPLKPTTIVVDVAIPGAPEAKDLQGMDIGAAMILADTWDKRLQKVVDYARKQALWFIEQNLPENCGIAINSVTIDDAQNPDRFTIRMSGEVEDSPECIAGWQDVFRRHLEESIASVRPIW